MKKLAISLRRLSSLIRRQQETALMKDTESKFKQSITGELSRLKGLEFERQSVLALENYGFDLKQRFAAATQADGGIDLMGTWRFANENNDVQVAVQCKDLNKSVPVSTIRELESSLRKLTETNVVGVADITANRFTLVGVLAVSSDLSPAAKKWFDHSPCILSLALIRPDRPFCEFSMNSTMAARFPELRVVRQYNQKFASFVDIIIKRQG